jgi:hypothetical protein
MMRLVRAEVRRLCARRLVRATVALGMIAIVGGGILAFTTSHSLSQATFLQRQHAAQVARSALDARARQCLQEHGAKVDRDIPARLARLCLPNQPAAAHDPRFYGYRLQGVLQGSSGVIAIIGWALGASLVGAEFASRSMTTFLTWETRRLRVIAAKIGVVLVSTFGFALLALTAVALAMLPSLLAHGGPGHAGDPTASHFVGIILRGSLLATFAAGIGFAIASIGRNTAAALGVGFAYIIVLENILGNALRNWRKWLLLGNVIVFVSGKNGGDVPGRSVTGAGVFLGLVAVALLLGAASLFRARDIA